jgi:hypothetical protein
MKERKRERGSIFNYSFGTAENEEEEKKTYTFMNN